ncbi:YbaY family lipoprotein [Marinobacter sp. JSM 1782161]|uniref:YbaY family lipoprotein n=1 Tax=Marinobacter sp. JSM 1782161 TaxID=2685906 RepID=UPI0014038B22|nr:YbaY family lipoprotein [Marinobacter sp. JSM 1782161]
MNRGAKRMFKRMSQWTGISLVLGALVLASGCAWLQGTSDMTLIDGTVTYRERMMLPPGADVTVTLEDVSLADAPAHVIAETRFKADSAPPWNFQLAYDPDDLLPNRRYSLRAKVTVEDRLMFISTQANPVDPMAQTEPVDIVVSRTGGTIADKARADTRAHSLEGTFWELTHIGDDAIDRESDKRKLNIVLDGEDDRVSGFSGCNQFSGGYTLTGDQLQLGPLASTMMACFKGMEREQAFQNALQKTARYEQQGVRLTLFDASGAVLLKFVSGDQL